MNESIFHYQIAQVEWRDAKIHWIGTPFIFHPQSSRGHRVRFICGEHFYAINAWCVFESPRRNVNVRNWIKKKKKKNPLLIWTTRATPNKSFNTEFAFAEKRTTQKRNINCWQFMWKWLISIKSWPMWSRLHLSTTPLKQFVSCLYFNLLLYASYVRTKEEVKMRWTNRTSNGIRTHSANIGMEQTWYDSAEAKCDFSFCIFANKLSNSVSENCHIGNLYETVCN